MANYQSYVVLEGFSLALVADCATLDEAKSFIVENGGPYPQRSLNIYGVEADNSYSTDEEDSTFICGTWD